jgi:hypothetical protein
VTTNFNVTQDSNFMYKVTFWRVHATTSAMDKQKFVICVLLTNCHCQNIKYTEWYTTLLVWWIYFARKSRFICPMSTKLWASRHIFISELPNIKFYGNSSSGNYAFDCKQTGWREEPNRRFSRLQKNALDKVHLDNKVYLPLPYDCQNKQRSFP